MARNYSIAEAAEIITRGEDLEAIADIGKRYPLLAQKLTVVGTKAGEAFVDLMSYMPEHVSANKVNSAIKRQLENAEDAEDDEDAEEDAPKGKVEKTKKTGKAGRPKKVEEDIEEDDDEEDSDFDSMNNKQMYVLLGKMGKRKDCKEKYGDLSHDSMLKYLKKYGKASASEEDDVEDEDEDVEDDAPDYTGMKAMELYKLCKQRKIKAEAKKPAKYYIDLLKKADAAEAEDADDEDWEDDEDEVEEEAPKKKAGRPKKEAAAKKGAKKPVKKSEPEEDEDEDDDDDEWDI